MAKDTTISHPSLFLSSLLPGKILGSGGSQTLVWILTLPLLNPPHFPSACLRSFCKFHRTPVMSRHCRSAGNTKQTNHMTAALMELESTEGRQISKNDCLNTCQIRSFKSILRREIESYERLLGILIYWDVKESFQGSAALWRISRSSDMEEWRHKVL